MTSIPKMYEGPADLSKAMAKAMHDILWSVLGHQEGDDPELNAVVSNRDIAKRIDVVRKQLRASYE